MRQLLHVDAKAYSTFRLSAQFAEVWEVFSCAELSQLQFLQPPIVLGEGSNSLFLKDMTRPVLRYLANGCQVELAEHRVKLHVDAGHNWHQLVQFCVEQGWWGLENLALIPGSVGAAPVQNIGAYGTEFADCCLYVDFFHWQTHQVERLYKADCQFGYRDSLFKNSYAGRGLIVAVGLELSLKAQPKLSYQGLDHLPANCAITEVFAAVIAVRQSKLPDPAVLANCGSFFKNPVISAELYQQLLTQYPLLPGFPQATGEVKIPAAWLLDQCGFKGVRLGDVGCYPLQPLVLVNYGNGTAAELQTFVAQLQSTVQGRFGVSLEPEVRMYCE